MDMADATVGDPQHDRLTIGARLDGRDLGFDAVHLRAAVGGLVDVGPRRQLVGLGSRTEAGSTGAVNDRRKPSWRVATLAISKGFAPVGRRRWRPQGLRPRDPQPRLLPPQKNMPLSSSCRPMLPVLKPER